MKDRLKKFKSDFIVWCKKVFTKQNMKMEATDFLFIIFGCAFGSFAVVAVMVPNRLTTGGLTGIVRMLQKFVNLDFSLMYYIGAAIILIIAWIFLGFKEVKKIVLLSVLYPTIIAVFEKINFHLLEEKDMILAAVFCGVFMGISSGIVFWRGYSFASTDTLAKIIRKYWLPHMSLSNILLGIDAAIILGSAFIFDRNVALYALISQVISTKVVDMVMYGFETKVVQVDVITANFDGLKNYVLNELERGVSSVDTCGEYTQMHYKKMSILCSPRESMLIKKFLAREDAGAFVTILRVDTVWGEGPGFKNINKEE